MPKGGSMLKVTIQHDPEDWAEPIQVRDRILGPARCRTSSLRMMLPHLGCTDTLYIYIKGRARGSHHILFLCQYSIAFGSIARTPYLDWFLPISFVAKCHFFHQSIPLNDKVCQRVGPSRPRTPTISAPPELLTHRLMSLLVSCWILNFSKWHPWRIQVEIELK